MNLRRLTSVLVAAVVLLAGCSGIQGGDTTAAPTGTGTAAPTEVSTER